MVANHDDLISIQQRKNHDCSGVHDDVSRDRSRTGASDHAMFNGKAGGGQKALMHEESSSGRAVCFDEDYTMGRDPRQFHTEGWNDAVTCAGSRGASRRDPLLGDRTAFIMARGFL